MISVEIVVVGNEVLEGAVQDTNSSYLCRVVRAIGGKTRHISVVADDVEAIGNALKASLNRHTALIFTCGGLGPTLDDLTLAAVAQATALPLEIDPQAHEFVTTRYKELTQSGLVESAEITESRLKMALLPQGSRPISNPVGTAPAVLLQIQDSTIISLPGVPKELKAIVEGPLQPTLAEKLGGGAYQEKELIVNCGDESVLAPILQAVVASHPETYIKSRARGFTKETKFLITISASGRDEEQVCRLVDRAREELIATLNEAGITVDGD